MTRDEMEELKGLAASMGLYDDKNPCKRAVVLGKAIKALEQEPQHSASLKQVMWERDVAIDQLKQLGYGLGEKIRTDEDAISRQEALAEILKKPAWHSSDGSYYHADDIRDAIKNTLPVNPQPKMGHWEKMVDVYDLQQNRMLVPYGYDDEKFGNTPVYVCDCGCESNKNSRFCPDCGAKMVEPQERSEDK